MKPDLKKMDMESLDELISRCEDSMCQPFKKKKAAEPVEEAEPEAEASEESSSEEPSEKPDLSEMDMDDLLRLYEEMKAKE